MQLIPELALPYPPILQIKGASDDDKKIVESIRKNFDGMRSASRRLSASVALYNFCTNKPDETLREWLFIAAREGAFALRDFSEMLSAVRSLVGRCDAIKLAVDTGALKADQALFQASFPRVEKLRHSVAHPEFYANPDVKMSSDAAASFHGVQVDAGATPQASTMYGTFASSINGITVQYDVNTETALIVARIALSVFSNFATLDPLYEIEAARQRSQG